MAEMNSEITKESRVQVLAKIRELLGEGEWMESRHRWEARDREDALALSLAVDDLHKKLHTVRSRGAWLKVAYDNQRDVHLFREQDRRRDQARARAV